MLTEKDKAYIQERVAYALAAIEEAGATPGNLAAIIGQEIGLALQNKREQIHDLLEKLVATRIAIDEYFDSRTEYTYKELVAARDDIAALVTNQSHIV